MTTVVFWNKLFSLPPDKILGKYSVTLFRATDTDALIKWNETKDIYNATLTVPYPYTKYDAIKFIKKNAYSEYQFAIRDEEEYLIGCIGIKVDEVQPHKAILGYWLAKPYWGKGIMTEVVKVYTEYWFREFKLDRISASCFENNLGSSRVLEKAGFKLEGLMTKHYKKDGEYHNGKLYGLVK